MRPLASLFALRSDHSVDGALAAVRAAGWREVSRTRGDRVVVGPGGLVVVAERGGSGRIREEWADEARAHAQALERMTGRSVAAVVVLARHVDWQEPRPLRGATLVPAAGLAAHLAGLPRTLAPVDVEVLATRLQHARAV